MPVLSYDKQSKGAMAYLALAGEMLRRNDAKQCQWRLSNDSYNAVPAAG